MPSRRQVLASAVAVGIAGCTGSQTRPVQRWPQVHFDAANTGYAPDGELPADPAAASSPLGIYPVTSAVASGDRLVFGLKRGHVAQSLTDDVIGWTVSSLGDRSPTGTPALGDEHAFVTEGSHRGTVESSVLRALELDGASEAWQVTFDDQFALAPTLADGTVFVRSERGVHAVDADDGTIRWSHDAELFEVEGFDVAKDISPAVAGGTAYIPGPSGVTAYDAATGEEQWHAPAEKVRASPTVAGETVLVSGVVSGVTAVDADDGSERWSWKDGGMWTSPAVADGAVYAEGHDLVALGLETGDVKWRSDVRSDVFGSPIVVGNTVVVSSTTHTRALIREGGFLDGPGEERWSVGAGSVFTPTAVDEQLVIPSLEEKLWTIE